MFHSRIVTFLPVQIFFVPAGPKFDVLREGCDQKRHRLKIYFRVRERHILPRNVTNVTRHIFCHRKKWQMWHHSPKSETGTWEEIWLRPTLNVFGSRVWSKNWQWVSQGCRSYYQVQKKSFVWSCNFVSFFISSPHIRFFQILVFLCKTRHLVGARSQAPRDGGTDNAAGIISIWGPSPPPILQIHSKHEVYNGTAY